MPTIFYKRIIFLRFYPLGGSKPPVRDHTKEKRPQYVVLVSSGINEGKPIRGS